MDKDSKATPAQARIEIHHSDRMQASAEIANKPMKTVTSQENTDSPNASKGDMLTLRYVDSTEGALSRPHWVLVDRSKSKHDPLLGLRGLRPQIGSMPKLVDFKSGKDFFTRNGTFGGTVAATKGRSGDCTKTPRDSIGNRATAAVGNIRHSSERRTSTRRTKSAVDTSVVEAQVANSGAKASTSNKFRSSSTGASGSRDKGRIAFQQILVDGRAESLSLKRLSHLSQEVAASPKHKRIGSRTSGACTRVNAIGTTTDIPIESVDATVEEQETVTDTEEEDTISESEVESEATNSRVSPDSRAQQPKPSAAIDIPVFGRRAKLLARAAARQAVLAKLTTDESVSVSAEAHRIAQQRNDPNYDEGKAVATAVANRDRGLRPRAPPRTSTHEDDEGSDDDDVEEGEEDEEEGEYFDDDDGIYTEPAGRTQHMNPNHKRRRQRDNKADYVPAKMARKSLTAPSGRRRANTTDTRSPSARQSHTASLAPEVASTSTSSNSSASTPTPPPVKVDQAKTQRGRKAKPSPSKPWSCEYCGQSFGRQEHVKRHIKSVHSGEKPHQCQICGKRFSRNDNLTQHLKTHVAEEEALHEATGQNGAYGIPERSGFGGAQIGGAGFALEQTSRDGIGQSAAGAETRTQQQLQIEENHRRLANQGKL